MRRSAGPLAHRPFTIRAARGRPSQTQDALDNVTAYAGRLARRSPRLGARSGQWLGVAASTAALVLISGCERTESVQAGLRGSSAIQLYKPSQLNELVEINRIPDPEPSDPYDPSFPMATEVHQNVKVLTDLNALEFARLMNAITAWVAPEQGCAYCHDTQDLASDQKFTKLVSREMLTMTRAINTNWQSHVVQTGVTCWTCHRGEAIPSDIWFKTPDPETPSAGVTGWKGGQNVAGVLINGNSALPFDPLTPFLDQANSIAVQGTEALPYGNRQSIKQAEWTYSLMMYMSKSLGVNCTYCHHTRAMGEWDQSTPQRVTAWHGIRLVRDLNESFLNPLKPLYPPDRLGPEGDAPKAACATCHKGTYKPLFGETMLDDYPSLAGVLPGRIDPETEAAAIKALGGVSPQVAALTPSAGAAGAETTAGEAPEPAASDAGSDAETAPTGAESAAAESATAAQAGGEPKADEAGADPGNAQADAAPAESGAPASEQAAESAADQVGDNTTGALDAAPLESMTVSEIEAALETLIEKVNSVRESLDTLAPAVPDATGSDTDAGDDAQRTEGEGASADSPSAGAASETFEALRALLTEQAQQLEAAKTAAAALSESEARITASEKQLEEEMAALQTAVRAVKSEPDAATAEADDKRAKAQSQKLKQAQTRMSALQARLDQERLALQQQLEVVRGQRDSTKGQMASMVPKREYKQALSTLQRRVEAMQARLDQNSLALQQQLEVVRTHRDEAQRTGEERIAELHAIHEDALAEQREQIAALEARLEQNLLALNQQLEVVRDQRDSTDERVDEQVATITDEHEDEIQTKRQRLAALQARLDQNRLALEQQLQVVRRQRDAASAQAEEKIAAAMNENEDLLETKQVRLAALQARLDQNRTALEQQLDVVRDQRNAAREQTDARMAEMREDYEDQVAELQALIEQTQARLADERATLERQLAIAREERDAVVTQTESRIAELEETLAEERETLASLRNSHDAQLDTLRQQLADAGAEVEQLRAEMQATQEEHAQALAKAKGSVTRIRLLHEEAAELGGRITEEGILVNLGSNELRFASGSATLPARQLPTLDRTAALLKARPELTARIEGHTDSLGSADINERLSQQRAEAVRQALIERGIEPKRLTARGAGAAEPIADNRTARGRRENRRVEILVSAQGDDAEDSAISRNPDDTESG